MVVLAVGCTSSTASPPATLVSTTVLPTTSTTTVLIPGQLDTVVLVGDSLAQQSSSFLEFLETGKKFVAKFFGGTAPCDWLQTDLGLSQSSVLVISFTGNSLTSCMSDGTGGFLDGVAMIDKYRADIRQLVSEARTAGAAVVLVGQPVEAPTVADHDKVEAVNDIYRDLTDEPYVTFVDAGATVEAPDGSFARSLPCVAYEPKCAKSGSNVVRSDDGRHFCPGKYLDPCPVYASGAFRFAFAIATAVNGFGAIDGPEPSSTLAP